ncbi:MAG: hypothetical protein M5U28_36100 [Sandaracinaceae bacterium]|nr:hypothetical protein [Sandaracinaceae bacterium]
MTYVADHGPSAAAVQFLEQVGARRLDLSSDLARKHNLRAVPRIALELRVRPANGALIAGQWYVHGTSTAEVYVDQISRALLERIATQEHRDAYAIATRQCENDTAEWRKGARGEDQGAAHARRRCGRDGVGAARLQPAARALPPSFGYRHGIPPIERGTVLHPTARDASGEPLRLDVHDFTKLDREAAAEWTLPAFVTPASAQERAANHLADTMAKVLERVAEGSKRK